MKPTAPDWLIRFIPTGRTRAIPAKQLAAIAGYRNVRAMQRDLHSLRVHGSIVCSTTDQPHGYFIPEEKDEVARFCRQMQSRMNEIQKAICTAEQLI